MLSTLFRLLCTPWKLATCYLSKLWIGLFHFIGDIRVKLPDLDGSSIGDLEAATPGPDTRGFPAITDNQYHKLRRAFIESLDLDAICSLASQYNDGKPCHVLKKDSGSFNVCFFVEFDQGGPKWVVRVPIEPALDNPWDKLLSEVATIQYLERNTPIPVPHVRAYGCNAKLTSNGQESHMFLIADLIPGEPLDKRLLVEAEEEHRKSFYSQLIDILAELRKLEFPRIGSLMPDPHGSSQPGLGPVISMSAATLRQLPQPAFASAKEYMEYQFSLVSEFFSPPVCDHTIDDVKQEIFALHTMERIFLKFIDPQLDKGPFVLNHLDLRSPNIIVDKQLQIQGIIDWEFACSVPRQVFTPPSWITGHDSIETSKQMHVEFRHVLDEKSKSSALCDQLRREWYGQLDPGCSGSDQTDMAFCVAHVLRRPTDMTDIFCDFLAQTLSDKPLDDMISEFFTQHEELAKVAQRQTEYCERYTQYLERNGLYETEADELLAKSKALKEKLGWQ
ncbi:hypothetical protein F66182_10208 [Fusarium sp. NRRL 66182]|nr:hypothetical protein F66182_10208 [Fusarium sp. NRRL 66182]